MKYDFNCVINRTDTDSSKWCMVEAIFGNSTVLPLWVADMDFPIARPITEAIRKRTEHDIYGYARPGASVIRAIVNRMQRKYGWKIEPEWIVFTPGVVSALNVAVRAFTHPGDTVVLHDPVYYPFWSAVTNSGCNAAGSPLRLINGHYEIDLDDLQKRFNPKDGMMTSPPRTKMMILCSPHNPVGRVWSRDELIGMGRTIIDNDAIMVSDEVHCELLYQGFNHIPFASISTEFAQNSVVCMAATKTFNLAGLAASTIIIPNAKLRNAFEAARMGILPQPNVLALVALEAAYREGDEWLEQLLSYLQGNLAFLIEYFEKEIPEITVIKPEGTYLVWLDCRRLGMEPVALKAFFRGKAKVGLDDGYLFGPGGAGFQRINIACPRATLTEALERIKEAVNNL